MVTGKRKYVKTTLRELKAGDRFFYPGDPDKLHVAAQDLNITELEIPVNKIVK